MTPLHALADEAGIARLWTDADRVKQQVSDDSLRAILAALDLPAGSDADIAESRKRMKARNAALPKLLTMDFGAPLALPEGLGDFALLDEAGATVAAEALTRPGYYRLRHSDGEAILAIAPPRCRAIPKRGWGAAIQIPSLVGEGRPFGDFALLTEAVTLLGRNGADAVALSPTHAQSLHQPGRFAPYSPSSRLALNGLLADARCGAPDTDLIDWRTAGPAKLAALRAHFASQDEQQDFAAFLQARARAGLNAVQQAARDAGMAIGLIADLAVGVDPAGEEVRDDPGAFLHGLRVGAPPDPLGPQGQDWGLTSYSPDGLKDRGFAPFIAMLRANIPQGGGIRIDHAFGLQRLWVVPEGRPASEGAYLAYPFADLLRLIKLEAWRADAIVIAEDLGTRPPGFSDTLADAAIYGMAVLPFSRDRKGDFLPANAYPASAVAMSGTHDTATIAGWWTGRDLDWNAALDRGGDTPAKRSEDRAALWRVIGKGAPQPADDDPAPVVDAALAFLAITPCPLAIVPMEDLLGLVEQPNLPGTVDEHPNWRRRLPAPIDELLARPDVARRIAALNSERDI
ncbi:MULTISPECIES: 4-alpha-glucanotransferase [unclassified Sphingobium]|uniref:4-alpha-glucanotransferase n=1 Tax=unclassified Sphingobium TaxID=2611147 RepID=UPI0035A62C28